MEPTTPLPPTQITDHTKANKQKLVWGLICLVGPSALIVVSLVLYTVVNFISSMSAPAPVAGGELFSTQGAGQIVANIALFLVGVLAVVTWLPGIIVGIILLATRKK